MTVPESAPPIPGTAGRIPAESMARYLPGEARALPPRLLMQDVVIQLFSHRTLDEPTRVPAVVEPLLVWVLCGAARVEERSSGGGWEASTVQAGDFFLTHTAEPYDMRWQTLGGDTFEVMHLYLGLSLIERAARDVLGDGAGTVSFLDISGGKDARLSQTLEQLHAEVTQSREPSPLLLRSLAQAVAVRLVRAYRAPNPAARRDNALQAYKLRRVLEAMNTGLAQDFSLATLAELAELSEYHFSRLFKRATGLSPSRYFIRLRMARARQLLLDTQLSIIEVGLEVGYSSPSHFSQVFRREVGVTPSAWREQ